MSQPAPLAKRVTPRKRTLAEKSLEASTQEEASAQQAQASHGSEAESATKQRGRKKGTQGAKKKKEKESDKEIRKAVFLLREAEEEANVLKNMHTKVTEQVHRLQVEEMILRHHLEAYEHNEDVNIKDLDARISRFMTQYVTVKPEPQDEVDFSNARNALVNTGSDSPLDHSNFGAQFDQQIGQSYSQGSLRELLLGVNVGSMQNVLHDHPIEAITRQSHIQEQRESVAVQLDSTSIMQQSPFGATPATVQMLSESQHVVGSGALSRALSGDDCSGIPSSHMPEAEAKQQNTTIDMDLMLGHPGHSFGQQSAAERSVSCSSSKSLSVPLVEEEEEEGIDLDDDMVEDDPDLDRAKDFLKKHRKIL